MPLFPKFPSPVSDTEDGKKAGGGGYQWLMDKFIQLCADIVAIKDQTAFEDDKGDYRKLILNIPIAAGSKEGGASMPPVPVGTEWRIERISAKSSTLTAITVLLNDMAENGNFITALPQEAFAGLNAKFFEPNIILKEGEALNAFVIAGAEGAQNVQLVVWARVITEKPQGLAVGA